MAKVTGNQLQQQIRRLERKRDSLRAQVSGSVFVFPDQEKPKPLELDAEIDTLERRIAHLQTAQGMLNLQVKVAVKGKQLPLMEVVKLYGGLERRLSLLSHLHLEVYEREQVQVKKKEEEIVRATPQLTPEEKLARELEVQDEMDALRAALNEGNTKIVDIDFDLE